jgi:hypothetical protein
MDSLPRVQGVPVSYITEIIKTFHEVPDSLTREYLSLLYPQKAIKRILFKPYLGKWYPYIDSWSPNSDMQLTLFYGPINITISQGKHCLSCGGDLSSKNPRKNSSRDIAKNLALCFKCQSKIHFGYFDCLFQIILNSIKNRKSETSFEKIRCENLLEPRCGYPIFSESTNPCLLNHGIGLIVESPASVKILIAPLKKLKYYMIREGGIIGVIFGCSNKIINLESLENQLVQIFAYLEETINLINTQLENYEEKRIKLKLKFPQIDGNNPINQEYSESKINDNPLYWMVLLNFLNYYKSYTIKTYMNKLLRTPVQILKEIIVNLSKVTDLEILDFYELYNTIIPFDKNLRDLIEDEIIKSTMKTQNSRFLENLVNFIRHNSETKLHNAFLRIFQEKIFNQMVRINEEIQINRVLGVLGSNLLIQTNHLEYFGVIKIDDLIGRNFY